MSTVCVPGTTGERGWLRRSHWGEYTTQSPVTPLPHTLGVAGLQDAPGKPPRNSVLSCVLPCVCQVPCCTVGRWVTSEERS